jgi:hypothetical protein
VKLPQNRPTEIGPIPSPSVKIVERPELIWPSIPDSKEDKEHDRFSAPDHWIIKERSKHAENCQKIEFPGLGCELFWEKLHVSEQILILDKHFDSHAMLTLRENLCQMVKNHGRRAIIMDLRIITAQDEARNLFADISKLGFFNPDAKIGCKSYKKYGEFDIFHDRFAVTDGELWHFGGTVGGIQPDLTAVSRGGSAVSQKFINLFNQVWNALHTPGGRL